MSLLWSAERLANHYFPSVYLIEPIIPRGGIVLLHGKRGIGKSHFMMTLAACLGARGALFGRYPTFASSPVVYMSPDMTYQMLQRRLRRARRHYQYDSVHFFCPPRMNMLNFTPDNELVKEIQTLKPCLIAWDTLRKSFRGSTNEDDYPSLVYGLARELFPTATHLFTHHDKKTVVDQAALDDEEEFRGSGAWIDDADTAIHLKEIGPGRLKCDFTKVRDAESQAPIILTLQEEPLLLYGSGEPIQALTDHWINQHRLSSKADLERYLMGSFVGSPRIVQEFLAGRERNGNPVLHPPVL